MKNKLFLLAIFLLSLVSCEKDESKNPLATIVPGNFVKLDIYSPAIDANDKSKTFFGGILSAPSNNVVKYDMYVRYTNEKDITIGNYVFFKSITSFPYDLKITTRGQSDTDNTAVGQLSPG